MRGVKGIKGVKVLSQFVLGTNFRTHEGRGFEGEGGALNGEKPSIREGFTLSKVTQRRTYYIYYIRLK